MRAGRRCPGTTTHPDGTTTTCPIILTNGERYCPQHMTAYETRRGTPTQRGYGHTHRTLRKRIQNKINTGAPVTCATCGKQLTGTKWDLGHTQDRTTYIGPQCQPCNRSDGGKRGRATQTNP